MSEVAPAIQPVAPATQTQASPVPDGHTFLAFDADGKTEIYQTKNGNRVVPYDRFKAVNDSRQAAIATLEADRTRLNAEVEKHKSEADNWQFRAALQGKGITDPEDIAEFKDRFARAPVDEAGKKPTPFEWANKIAAAPPKWATGYFGTTPPAQVAAPAEVPVVTPAAPPQAPPPQAPRVNGGTQPAPPPPTGRLTDAQVAAMTPAERIASAAKIVGDQQVKNPQLRKAMGLPPLTG